MKSPRKGEKKVAILDYGIGNPRSIENMCRYLHIPTAVTESKEVLLGASHVILPGVGHFGKGMQNLKNAGLDELLIGLAREKATRLLGICLGMHLMMEWGEEAGCRGIGLIPGKAVRFSTNNEMVAKNLPVPHMGWSRVDLNRRLPSLASIHEYPTPRFYFAHSYHVTCDDTDAVIGTTRYGYEFPSMIKWERVFGVQFHPEKSHKFGLSFLKWFWELRGDEI